MIIMLTHFALNSQVEVRPPSLLYRNKFHHRIQLAFIHPIYFNAVFHVCKMAIMVIWYQNYSANTTPL